LDGGMKSVKALIAVVALLIFGCGGPDLDDKETLDGIIAEAIDSNKLQLRSADVEEPLLIPCKACKEEVSWKGEVCANCSHPIADSVRAYKDGLSDEKLAYAPNQQKPYTGWVKRMWSNGQIRTLIQLKDGKLDGLRTYWHENGQKREEVNFMNGKRDGLWTEWYENGQKEFEENYKDGKSDGNGAWWHKNGQKKFEENYKDGKLMTVVAWKPNGEKCPVTNVVNGNGVWVWYNDDGTENSRHTFKDGEEVAD
jgi:antitoxin component YwqK of YwqJK toxin-antitoxin module